MDGVSIPDSVNNGILSLQHRVQTGSGAHPPSYPMVTGGSYTAGKAAGA